MSLSNYHSKLQPGTLLICDFDIGGFTKPEMVKKRPVVVISSSDSLARGVCTVVPLSTTTSKSHGDWHHSLSHVKIPGWEPIGPVWAKCDMVCTVAFHRLDKPYLKTRQGRVHKDIYISAQDLDAIRACMRTYLGL